MSDCKLYSGELRGKKCGVCREPLRVGDIVYQWGEMFVEVGCLVRYASERLDPPSSYLIHEWHAP